jgi:hypothetical protein
MLTNKDREYAKKRKRVWDLFDWKYMGVQYLSKNHSLNCGCATCRMITYERKYKNKQKRLSDRKEIKKIILEI